MPRVPARPVLAGPGRAPRAPARSHVNPGPVRAPAFGASAASSADRARQSVASHPARRGRALAV